MTDSARNPERSEAPRQVPGNQPGDYGVRDEDRVGASPDAGNVEDIDTLTAPLDEDDDVYDRIALVNTEEPDTLEQAPDAQR